jgi:hypothetical protein
MTSTALATNTARAPEWGFLKNVPSSRLEALMEFLLALRFISIYCWVRGN